MDIIINNNKIFKAEDRMTLQEFLELADYLKPFVKFSGFSKPNLIDPSILPQIQEDEEEEEKTREIQKEYNEEHGKLSGKTKPVPQKPYIKYKTRRRMRHRWLNREHAIQAIKVHYLGTKADRETFAEKEGTPWVELCKGFSGLIRRFKMKPSEIGVAHFGRDNIRSSNEEKLQKDITNFKEDNDNDVASQVYNLRQGGMDFADIKKKFNITNKDARKLYQKYYNRVYQRNYNQNLKNSKNIIPGKAVLREEVQQTQKDKEEHPNIKIAEQQLVQFFSEIDKHTPDQVKQTIRILSNFLKNVKDQKGDKEDILNFFSKYFSTPVISPSDIDNWLSN